MHLAIDSSIKGYSAALWHAESFLFDFADNGSKSQHLVTDLKSAFEKSSIHLSELEYLIANIGPGSFTGIRTALTIVKTLEANLNLKVLALNNFQILRYLNPSVERFAFRASLKNTNEFFVSLDENFDDIKTNFFTSEDPFVEILELPRTQDMAKTMIDFVTQNDNLLEKMVVSDVKPYYLREPSLRLAKNHAAK
jgi:tRNA A37 threonylcarbamoyladenosine modification protein TsaB